MSRIRAKDTKPELAIRKFLHSKGLRYRLHDKKLPGKPDLVFKKIRLAIFIHGCFWHGHKGCKYFVIPKTRTIWWKNKIFGNRLKDKDNLQKLKNLGWKVITVWECDIRPDKKEKTMNALLSQIGIS